MSEIGTRHWDYILVEDYVLLRLCCGRPDLCGGPRSTFQTLVQSPVCGVSTERKGTNVLDVRVWGVGGVLFVVPCIAALESVGEIVSTVENYV